VAIPPAEVQPPIQDLRRRYDRQFRRWMPHLTLLYPFRPREEFAELLDTVRTACRSVPPFEVELREFRAFAHGERSVTLWLAPLPADGLANLHRALLSAFPDCVDTAQFEGGYTPHLSVGQVRGPEAVRRAEELRAQLQAGWQPLRVAVREVSLLWRNEPPDDVFRVAERVALGA
jgi:2'-5' RNA ligase